MTLTFLFVFAPYFSSDLEKDLDLSDSDDGSGNGIDTIPAVAQQMAESAPAPIAAAVIDRKREAPEA